MAHEISLVNGKSEMAFIGDRSKIWHGLGQELTPGSSIETWQREAGMDWDINSSALSYTDQDLTARDFKGKKVLYRNDTRAPLSVVSDRYQVVQPKQVLEFFRSLVNDAGMELSTAGTLFGGKKFWALADTKQKVALNDGRDVIGGYLLLSTSCDGTLATSAQFTSVRVVCNNTLNIALMGGSSDAKQKVSTSHSTIFNPNDFKMQLGLTESAWDKFVHNMEDLTQVSVTPKDAYNLIMSLIAEDDADPSNAEIRTTNEIHGMFMGSGMGANVAGKTAYGLLNAFTEYYDHHVGRIASNRLNSSFWGIGNKKKNEAFATINSLYGVGA